MSTTPAFLYRQLSPGGDPLRGQSQQNFLSGLPAVAQAILTRMRLLRGEWWSALDQGLPLFQSILGVPNTNQGVALLLRQNILGGPYVTGITNLVVTYGSNRQYTFSCDVQTQFGTVQIVNQAFPGNNASVSS